MGRLNVRLEANPEGLWQFHPGINSRMGSAGGTVSVPVKSASSTNPRPSRLRFAAEYFGCVFGLGFVLGVIRTLWLLPNLGERWAELTEFPFMMTGIALAARWLLRRHPTLNGRELLQAGALATAWVLLADIGVGIGLRGMILAEVFLDRDPIAGAAYYLGLLFFALAPWVLRRAT